MTTTLNIPSLTRLKIKSGLTCPHCWHDFSTDQILFISESPELLGDSKLTDVDQLRFLPLRFDAGGAALDSHGFTCHKLACPNCHLQIPRTMLYTSPFFLSIAGAPASGKSYFLTSMIWRLRKIFARDFCLSFTDADATMNKRIREYESIQFLGSDPNKIVAIEKTEAQGDIYNLTRVSGQEVFLAQPFTFAISPMPNYPSPETGASIGQTVCFYDNAGESFLPGSDHASQPVTRHLATSDAILFLFDPTQDPRFQKACTKAVEDPQMNPTLGGQVRRSEVRQETVLTEMITRIRAHARLSAQAKHKAPLVIVLTKVDAWRQLANFDLSSNPWNPTQGSPVHTYNPRRVEEFSQILRKLLIQLIPDLVSTAESFARHVTYIAVSATGGPPSVDSNTGAIGFRSGKIRPVWTEVPFFQAQALANKSCFPTLKTKSP